MPSIPQSLLWISLVVLWLFVLVPMLINKRDAVKRTSDVALATRVLNSGRAARLIKRGGPAAGHASDPHWQREEDFDDDLEDDDEERTGPVVVTSKPHVRSVAVVTSLAEEDEPDYLDVDVVDEDSGALPVAGAQAETPQEEPAVEPGGAVVEEPAEAVAEAEGPTEVVAEAEDANDGTQDEYEYIEDTSGLEAEDEPPTTVAPAARERRYESKTAAAVSARKYRFRKNTLLTMAVLLVASAATAFLLSPSAWWVCGGVGAITLLYLAYLRRQTRIEERLRRRRMQRMARSRLGVENTQDRDLDVMPARLRQPGAAVLEIDDEDPEFEHLDYVPFARQFDLPRAAGQ